MLVICLYNQFTIFLFFFIIVKNKYMSKLPRVTGFKKYCHITINFSKALIILGLVFKFNHWPFSVFLLVLGGSLLSIMFILYALDIPREDYDWTIVYPELTGMGIFHEEIPSQDTESRIEKLEKQIEELLKK